MPDKAWKVSHTTWDFFNRRYYGVSLSLVVNPGWPCELRLVLNLGAHNHTWRLRKEYQTPCLTKPGKPSSAG